MRIAVKLARKADINPNLFLAPPAAFLLSSEEESFEELYRILKKMRSGKANSCADHFMHVARDLTLLEKTKECVPHGWEQETVQVMRPAKKAQILELYLFALLEQSESLVNAQLMVQHGLLPALWRICQAEPSETGVRSLAVQIVANLSQHSQLHVHIFQSGWVGLLAQLLTSPEIRLSIAAGKVLCNMDATSRRYGTFDSCVYLLHPLRDDGPPPPADDPWRVDVIFVHGLLGGVFWTWRQSDTILNDVGDATAVHSCCWPQDWLPTDVSAIRILGVNYTTSLSHWASQCPNDVPRYIYYIYYILNSINERKTLIINFMIHL